MLQQVTDGIMGLAGAPVYTIVFLLAFLETSAFIGLVVPGELAVLVGGVLAFQGKVELFPIALVAILGAVAGDSAGYSIGKRWGHRLLGTKLGKRLVRPKHLDRAETFISRKGGISVLLARFTTVLRVLVPGLAGMAQMPYRIFFPYNLLGAILWAGGLTLGGYVAGNAWRNVQRYAARASAILAVLLIAALVVVWVGRWLIRNEDLLRGWGRRLLERPRVAAIVTRFDGQIQWGSKRLEPGGAFGLYLTIGAAISFGLMWAFGAAVQDVIAREELAGMDRPVANLMMNYRAGSVTQLMILITRFGSRPVVLAVLVLAVLITAARMRSIQPAAFLAGAASSGYLLDKILKQLVRRPAPPGALVQAGGYSFPSAHTVAAVIVYGGIAFVVARVTRRVKAGVWAAGIALLIALLVAVSRVYLGVSYASDVVAGAALGGATLAICATAWAVWGSMGRTPELRMVRAHTAKRVVRFAFFAGSLGLAVHLVLLSAPGIRQSLIVFQRLNPGLIAFAIALGAGSNLALAQLYRAAVTAFDHDIGFAPALRLSMGMFTLSRILPAGGAAAAVFGAKELTDLKVPAASGVTSVTVAGVLGMVTLVAIVEVGAAGALLRGDLAPSYIAPMLILLGMLGALAYLVRRTAQNMLVARRLLGRLEGFLGRLGLKVNLSPVGDVMQDLSQRKLTRRDLGPLFGWSALNWLLDVAVLWLVFAALGRRLRLGVLLVGYGVANIAAALPITPGGLGLVEAGMSSALTVMGVPGSAAVVGVLGYRLISYWLPLLAGVPQYLASARRAPVLEISRLD